MNLEYNKEVFFEWMNNNSFYFHNSNIFPNYTISKNDYFRLSMSSLIQTIIFYNTSLYETKNLTSR